MSKQRDLKRLKSDLNSLRNGKTSGKAVKNRDKLGIRETNVKLDDFQGDLLQAIDHINTYKWLIIPPQFNSEFINHINKFRTIIPLLVSKSQLYSLFLNETSIVDQTCSRLFKENKIKIIHITKQQFIANDLIIKLDDYKKILKEDINKTNNPTVSKFAEYITKENFTIIFKSQLPFTESEIGELINLGFLAILPTNQDQLTLSIPKYGFIVKLLITSCKLIIRYLRATKWKELPINELNNKYKTYKLLFKDLKGIRLNWILHHLIGEGQLEVFKSFDGDKVVKCV